MGDATVSECIKLMLEKGIGNLIVVAENKPIGIVTRRNLFGQIIMKDTSLLERKVSDIMSSPVVTVKPRDKIDYAVNVMREKGITAVLVMDGSRLVGTLLETDIRLRLRFDPLSYRSILKRYLVDTFAYMVFWPGFTVVIQVFLVGIPLDKFVQSSILRARSALENGEGAIL
ncbi:MAG: CBS domain-containing protein [Candidatus Bathyarchaeota archaeon]